MEDPPIDLRQDLFIRPLRVFASDPAGHQQSHGAVGSADHGDFLCSRFGLEHRDHLTIHEFNMAVSIKRARRKHLMAHGLRLLWAKRHTLQGGLAV